MNGNHYEFANLKFRELVARFRDVAGVYMQPTRHGYEGTLDELAVELIPNVPDARGMQFMIRVSRTLRGVRITDGELISVKLEEGFDWQSGGGALTDTQINEYFVHRGPPPVQL